MNFNRLTRLILLVSAQLFFVNFAWGQNKIINGRVTNSKDGSGLAGVSVIAVGSHAGTQSDANGNFQLNVPANTSKLRFTAIGFSTVEVKVGDNRHAPGFLNYKVSALNEVVVVGYGTTRRKDITGAVARVTAKEFNTGIITSPLQQITRQSGGPGDCSTRRRPQWGFHCTYKRRYITGRAASTISN